LVTTTHRKHKKGFKDNLTNRNALLKFMTDEGLRHDLRVEGRKVAEQHTYEDERNALRFWEAWSG
jgi:hypothetical protein